MAVELIPKKTGQHVVTFVPKVTTDLPFFNLTYRRKDTPSKIKFDGKDGAGNPIHWEVRHNTDDDIGYAGVQAHEVWYLLIKPAIDAGRQANGKIPNIIPLGGIRESLRMIGWTEGGHQARDLIRALTQISFAGIIADLWFPTGELDKEGNPTFKQVKGRFSRMSVYAIGEQHLTEDDLKQIEFNFDLEDTVYIKLDPLEVLLQEAQADQQRLIDNEYMFSVKPVARRWYELMAGKVYGTLKYNKPFFEIRYSWYVKHHHNLKKFYTLKAIKRQMKQVVQDHLASGFLTKVEYRKHKEPDQELDFIIRYYVGQTAQDSVNRIKGYLLNRERQRHIEVKRANVTPQIAQNKQDEVNIPDGAETGDMAANLEPQSKSEDGGESALSTVTNAHIELMQKLMFEYQISGNKACHLVTEFYEEAKKQVEAFPFREIETKNKAGFLIKAIEESYSLPDGYLEHLKRQKERLEIRLRKELIKNCPFCRDKQGYREVKAVENEFGIDSVMHQCTHDAEIEAQYEDYRK